LVSYNNHQWRKLRSLKIAADPLCEYCLHHKKVTEAQEVDHVIPPTDNNDPLFYEYENLLSTCRRCHIDITHKQQSIKDTLNKLSFEEAKKLKLSLTNPRVNVDGYY